MYYTNVNEIRIKHSLKIIGVDLHTYVYIQLKTEIYKAYSALFIYKFTNVFTTPKTIYF